MIILNKNSPDSEDFNYYNPSCSECGLPYQVCFLTRKLFINKYNIKNDKRAARCYIKNTISPIYYIYYTEKEYHSLFNQDLFINNNNYFNKFYLALFKKVSFLNINTSAAFRMIYKYIQDSFKEEE
jgi:hypothetical protein